MQNKQFPRAVELYTMAKRYSMAIDMCLQHKVTIKEDMVENLTPPEGEIWNTLSQSLNL